MKFLNSFLEVNQKDRSSFQIIIWWEMRRNLYNIIILIVGSVNLKIISVLVNTPPEEDLVEPIAILGFGILCNLGYTLGWITELLVIRDKKYGPKMFKIGLYFTLFFVFLPLIFHVLLLFKRI